MENDLLSQQEYENLFSEDSNIKNDKQLLNKIQKRFNYIMVTSGKMIGRNWDWFDYQSPLKKEDIYIDVIGQSKSIKNSKFIKYDEQIPVKWLWTVFEEDLKRELNHFEQEEKSKENNKQKKNIEKANSIAKIKKNLPEIKEKIQQKVPEDIYDNITFKNAEEIYAQSEKNKNQEFQAIKEMLKVQKEHLQKILTPEEFEAIEFKRAETIFLEMEIEKN